MVGYPPNNIEGGTCVHVYIAMKSKRDVHIQSNTLALSYKFLNILSLIFSNFGIRGFMVGTTPVTHISSFHYSFFKVGLVEDDSNLDNHT